MGSLSVLLLLETVVEEVEGRTVVGLLLHQAVAEAGIPVATLTSPDLDLVPSGNKELDELGCALLEDGNAIGLTGSLELLLDGLEVSLDVAHETLLVE